MKGLFVCFFCASSIALFAQPELRQAKVDRNVVYGMYSGLALLMDVYYPEQPNGYGVIHISGSGWSKPLGLDARLLNHQGHVEIEGTALVAAGYTVFSINHRATPRFTYPAAVEDAQRAVRYIRHHADQYNIAADRIGAVGGSSGGHLVCMLGVLDGTENRPDASAINLESAKVQCVIARAPPTTFISSKEELIGEHFLNMRLRQARDTTSAEYQLAREASPIFHVSADDPPFLFLHGDQDDIVPFSMSEIMQDALQAEHIPVRLLKIEGAGHGPAFPGALHLPDLGEERVKWLDKHLKKP
ncbi:MAG: alpha/beta hydrolase [Saprospiraceae bacterium]|nr:alpha/beta hydrolase [Saprospiraceae bacterium]